MKHLPVLAVSAQPITTKLNWKLTIVSNVEKAIEQLYQHKFKVVVISDVFSVFEINKLKKILSSYFAEVKVAVYTTESELAVKIHRAYWSKKKRNTQHVYADNSLALNLSHALKSTLKK